MQSAINALACPFCNHHPDGALWETVTEKNERILTRICVSCGAAYPAPPPSPETLAAAYSTAYYGHGDKKFGSLIERFRHACAAAEARRLVARLDNPVRILDIGCGNGDFLKLLQSLTNAQCEGIEPPGSAADRAARVPGLIIHRTTLEQASLPLGGFDLVTARHVYEHLPNPIKSLDQLATLVRPGGLLFLSFPNIDSWQASLSKGTWFHLDPPRHLCLPRPSAVISQLHNRNFVSVHISYFSLEQNIYGWLQSLLNRADPARNYLYEKLKGNRFYLPDRSPLWLGLHAFVAALCLPPAILLEIVSLAARRGATVQLTFRKKI